MRRITFHHSILFAAVLLLLTAVPLLAEPQVITIQGRLTNTAGLPLDGNFDITFRIYELPSPPGSPLWVESHMGVSVNEGLFSVNLGISTPLDASIFETSPRYLGITVGIDPEIAPRTRMGASPYALRAESMPGFTPGPGNEVMGEFSFAAGDSNRVVDGYSSIAGGEHNTIEILNFTDTLPDTSFSPGVSMEEDLSQGRSVHAVFGAFIGGGFFNHAHGMFSCVLGGINDSAVAALSTVGCGINNWAHAPASFAVIDGGFNNRTWGAYSSLGGGQMNMASGVGLTYIGETIAGGVLNRTLDHVATVGGGRRNFADGFASTIGGGEGNVAFSNYSTIGGGQFNNAAPGALHAHIGGGLSNSASAPFSGIGAGQTNVSTASHAYVGGGANNTAGGDSSVVGGGIFNAAIGVTSTIAGGGKNGAFGNLATVGGGGSNSASADFTVVAGGTSNVASGIAGAVGGGTGNSAGPGANSTVSGGFTNVSSGANDAIGGGSLNVAGPGSDATIAGGHNNVASGVNGAVGGGTMNVAGPGANTTVPGGFNNVASGDNSFAAGTSANAVDTCSFVWADCCRNTAGSVSPLYSTGFNSWTARATGGFYLLTGCDSTYNTSAPGTSGVYIPAGGSTWLSGSHSSLKENIVPVDGEELLEKIDGLDINRWNYKAQDASVGHIGPMAEDFYSTFGVGDNEFTMSSIDPAGIALAAIKELNKKTKQLELQGQKIGELEAKLDKLMKLMENAKEKN